MITFNVLFEDDDIMVIDKPSGTTVNNSDTTKDEDTVQKAVSEKIEKESLDEEFVARGGIVHRLDKETSGILIIAKNPNSFHALKEQFMERSVKKKYIALAHGEVLPSKGEISTPIGRVPWDRKKFGVLPGGRNAQTSYEVTSIFDSPFKKEKLSLVSVYPQTGRTHQIRVHLKYINHPIFSDAIYAGRKVSRDDRKILPRIFLHASQISFQHPSSKEMIELKSPLPKDLENFLNMIKLK